MAGGSSSGGNGDEDEMITAINVTPLVDVVLVLLIILMVTASYIVSKSIPLTLPSAETADPSANPPRVLAISIDPVGNLFLDAEPIDDAILRSRAEALVTEVGEAEARATIAADTTTAHGEVVHVMDLLRRARVTHFAINVRPEDLAPEP